MPVSTDPDKSQNASQAQDERDLKKGAVLPEVGPRGGLSHGGKDIPTKCIKTFAMFSQSVISPAGHGGKALEIPLVQTRYDLLAK